MPNDDKNWMDLTAMLDYYNDEWKLNSEYLTDYGCHCRNNLDRRQEGLGSPYGAVDTNCHIWKQCLKCARTLYGDECTAQDIKYNVKLSEGSYQCQNAPGTCRKAICECDLGWFLSFVTTFSWFQQFSGIILPNQNSICPTHGTRCV